MTTEKNNAEFQDLNELIVGVAFALFWALGIWYFSKNNTTPELNQATPSIVKGAAGAAAATKSP